jgi:site-specific DNA-methyltransferase (adenine-specific)
MQLKLGALKLKIRTPICDNRVTLLLGDCLTSLHKIPSDSVDSIVTDPPYGLNFMEKKWDYDIPSVEIWSECLRMLKPGGHMLASCGTRTQHRMVVNIENAGFEIRDVITHLYGQGFPKSHDISKAIDKAAGADRETIGVKPKTAPATEEAKQWSGWGSALKPACEFWTLCRKPLSESTIAKNVLKHGTGGLNIDATRIEGKPRTTHAAGNIQGTVPQPMDWGNELDNSQVVTPGAEGRFPSNVILDEDAAQVLDEQTKGVLHSAGKGRTKNIISEYNASSYHAPITRQCNRFEDFDNVGASRFFYVAKASKSDRGDGNVHPTVKPIKLMEYLIKLITQPNGVVLDPFMGSGTAGVAAKKLGFRFIGMEKEPEYLAIAEARIKGALCL